MRNPIVGIRTDHQRIATVVLVGRTSSQPFQTSVYLSLFSSPFFFHLFLVAGKFPNFKASLYNWELIDTSICTFISLFFNCYFFARESIYYKTSQRLSFDFAFLEKRCSMKFAKFISVDFHKGINRGYKVITSRFSQRNQHRLQGDNKLVINFHCQIYSPDSMAYNITDLVDFLSEKLRKA